MASSRIASRTVIRRLLECRPLTECRGAGLVEYLVLVGVIAILTVGAWRIFGRTIRCQIYRDGYAIVTLDAEELGYCPVSIPATGGEG